MIRPQISVCLGVAWLTCWSATGMAQTLRVFEAQGIPQTAASQDAAELLGTAGFPIAPGLPDPNMLPDTEAYEYGEELLRGPVHEAFAEQYNQEPVEGLIVDREPPPDVPEVPPELKPEGNNIEWISGYWFWDDDRDDFIWVSGVWRHMPPGQRWVPGYWAQLDEQYQWVGGTWVGSSTPEIEYIAQAPPESLDLGPVGNAPSEQHFWIPGCWNWNQASYAWRPGYWSTGYTNWIWVPQRFLWTPRGYVLCNGYWDYPIVSRGTLFAPFWFRRPAYANVGFRHAPRLSLLASGLQAHLWISPQRRHYLFGDYYANNYRRAGIFPWHTVHHRDAFRVGNRGLRGYDPLFAHASRTYGQRGINLTQQISNQYNIYTNRSDRRPPQTLDEQRRRSAARVITEPLISRNSRSDEFWNQGDRMAESIRDRARQTPTAFTRVSTDQRSRLQERALETPALARLRSEIETGGRQRSSSARSSAAEVNSPDPGPNRRHGAARILDPLPMADGSRSRGSARAELEPRPDDGQRPSETRRSTDTSRLSGTAQDARSSALAEQLDATINGRSENARWRLPQAADSNAQTPSRSTRSTRGARSESTAGATGEAASSVRPSERASSIRSNPSDDARSALRSRIDRATSDPDAAAEVLRRSLQTRRSDAARTGSASGPAATGRDQRTNRLTPRPTAPQSAAPQSAAPQPQVSPSTPPGRSPADRRNITFPGSTSRDNATDALQSLRSRAAEGAGAALERNRSSAGRPAASEPAGPSARATAGRVGADRGTDAARAESARALRSITPASGPSIRGSRTDAAGPSLRGGTPAGGAAGPATRSSRTDATGPSIRGGTPAGRATGPSLRGGRTDAVGPSIRGGAAAGGAASSRRSTSGNAASGRSPAARGPTGRSDAAAGRGAAGRGDSGRSGRGRR